jgi:hypothetical protein
MPPLLVHLASLAAAAALTVTPSGPPASVWGSIDALHKCGVNDVPDIPPRAFLDDAGLAHMIVGSTAFHRMTGPTVFNQTRSCTPTWNSTQDADPAMFASAEWLDSPHVFPNGTVVALVHVEYDAMNIAVPKCPHSYPLCWSVAVTQAISDDFGATWRHARAPPAHLVAAVPYAFNASQPASGWGDPSNIFQSPLDGLYYVAVLNRNRVGLQAPGICFARTADLTDPASWRAWSGVAWNVSWVSPYAMAPGTEAAHVCAPVVTAEQCMPSGVVWSAYLGLFVATLDCIDRQGALYMATSADLVQWSAVAPFYDLAALPADVRRNVTSMTYPTFIDPTASAGGNFMAIGQDPPLFWVSIGHSPYTDGRRVWATPMHFEK